MRGTIENVFGPMTDSWMLYNGLVTVRDRSSKATARQRDCMSKALLALCVTASLKHGMTVRVLVDPEGVVTVWLHLEGDVVRFESGAPSTVTRSVLALRRSMSIFQD